MSKGQARLARPNKNHCPPNGSICVDKEKSAMNFGLIFTSSFGVEFECDSLCVSVSRFRESSWAAEEYICCYPRGFEPGGPTYSLVGIGDNAFPVFEALSCRKETRENQAVDKLKVNQSINQSIDQSINQRMNEWMNEWMKQAIERELIVDYLTLASTIKHAECQREVRWKKTHRLSAAERNGLSSISHCSRISARSFRRTSARFCQWSRSELVIFCHKSAAGSPVSRRWLRLPVRCFWK